MEIRNLYKTTGENFPYQLLVGPPRPDFELTLASDNPYVYATGDPAKLKVTCVRRDGFEGPVALALSGLPAGVSTEPVTIPEGKNDGEFTLTARGAKPGDFGHIEIVSAAHTAWRAARISSGGGEGAASAKVYRATLAVAEQPRFSLEAAASTINLVRGGTAEFTVSIQRAAGFREAVRFSMENLPAGVTLAEAAAGPDVKDVKLKLTAAPSTRTGRAARVAILGAADCGETAEAPRVSLSID